MVINLKDFNISLIEEVFNLCDYVDCDIVCLVNFLNSCENKKPFDIAIIYLEESFCVSYGFKGYLYNNHEELISFHFKDLDSYNLGSKMIKELGSSILYYILE